MEGNIQRVRMSVVFFPVTLLHGGENHDRASRRQQLTVNHIDISPTVSRFHPPPMTACAADCSAPDRCLVPNDAASSMELLEWDGPMGSPSR